jgi:NAD(P)-dependent dehydrogenase (short-subunit alcohol dehydrogenase family)
MLPAPFSLAGRIALVTGAGAPDGIGFATAHLLGALGAHVAVAATSDRALMRAAELEAAGIRSVGVVADLTDEDQVLDAVAAVTAALGSPTVLVNNAGMTSVSAPSVDVSSAGGTESGTVGQLDYDQWRPAGSLPAARRRTRPTRAGTPRSAAAPPPKRSPRPLPSCAPLARRASLVSVSSWTAATASLNSEADPSPTSPQRHQGRGARVTMAHGSI